MHGSIYDHPGLPPLPRPASRLIVRLLAETQLGAISGTIATLGEILGRPPCIDRAIFLLMVLRREPSFQPGGAAGDPSAGISVNAISSALGRPFETVRRHVNTLIDQGLLQRGQRGVTMAPGVIDDPRLQALLRQMHDGVVAFAEDLRRFEIPLPAARGDRAYDPAATMAAAIDFALSPFELLSTSYRNPLELAIVNVTITVGARGYAFDPVVSRRFAEVDTVPPEDLRLPIAVTALAAGLHVSYATARREVELQVKLGRLKRVPGGVIATDAYLSGAVIANGSQHAAMRAAMVLRRLVPAGFRFDDPARCYLEGRPPLAPY